MTKIVKREMYCKKCEKNYEVGVLMSTNSYMIEKDPILKKRYEEGTLMPSLQRLKEISDVLNIDYRD